MKKIDIVRMALLTFLPALLAGAGIGAALIVGPQALREYSQWVVPFLGVVALAATLGAFHAARTLQRIAHDLGAPPATLLREMQALMASGVWAGGAPDPSPLSLASAIRMLERQWHETLKHVADGTRGLQSATDELSVASAQIAAVSGQQGEAAASMSASIQQMLASISQATQHSEVAMKVSQEAGTLSHEGTDVVQRAAGQMSHIAESMQDLNVIIERLGSQSSQISRIIHVIQEIANQTNLLALNAAIEAARAGEQGRGFSVVADEVRKLAERTTESTREIGTMIQTIQEDTAEAVQHVASWSERVTQGVAQTAGAGACMSRIQHGASDVVQVVTDINAALNEQTGASQDIARNVNRIASASHQNAAAVQAVTAAARQVASLLQSLNDTVSLVRSRRSFAGGD